MQILKLDLKNDTIKLRTENLDDLWTIYNTVQPGDLVRARTFRREKIQTDDSRPERGQKQPVFLSVRIEKVEFHKYVNMLRLIGRIESGTDIGRHHSINIEPGTSFSLVRDWRKAEIDLLKEAARESSRPMVLLVALDEGEASLALVRQRGVDFIDQVSTHIPGKREEGAREAARKEFHSTLLRAVVAAASSRGLKQAIVVGPELIRTGFKKFVEDRGKELAGDLSISYDTCFSPGRTGIYEAIRRGAVDRIVASNRVSTELSEVENFLGEVAREGRATYGLTEVTDAARSGAVDTLLVTDQLFRERRKEADALMREVERYSGRHVMISTDHEGGTKLQSLGGLGAILRYRIETPSAPEPK